jgi:hypothetical protein
MKYIFALLTAFAISSCSKESISPTQAQVTAAKLKNDINTKGISNISVSLNNGQTNLSGTGYSITPDGFITIVSGSGSSSTTYTFNLGQLKLYYVLSGSTLVLIF